MRAYLFKKNAGLEKPAAFLDRDGTIIHDRPGYYLLSASKMKLYKKSVPALKIIQDLGFRLIIITNQSAVARGYMTLEKSREINAALAKTLKKKGVLIEGIYFCPHSPQENCSCRKPKTGLVKEALKNHKISLKDSVLVGDKKSDMELAAKLGIKAVFVKTGHGRSQPEKNGFVPELITENIMGAAQIFRRKKK